MKDYRIKLNKESIVNIMFVFLLIFVLFFKWYFNFDKMFLVYPIILAFLALIFKRFMVNKNQLILLLLLIFYIFINVFITNNGHNYLSQELISFNLAEISILIIFNYLSFNKDNFENILSNKLFYFLNIYYFINFIIMTKQIGFTYFMMRHIEGNPFYIDHITGLIGESGTHRLTLLNISCLLLNYLNFNSTNKYRSIFSKVFFVLIIITSFYISSYNGNRAYYYLLFLIGIFIFLDYLKNSLNKGRVLKIMFLVLFVLFSLHHLYNNNITFKKFIDEKIVFGVLERTNRQFSSSNELEEERIALFKYALNNGNGYTYGKGIGNIRILGDTSMPSHFGISEITSRVYNGGLIYLLLLFLLYTSFFSNYFPNKNLLTKCFVYGIMLFLVAYQQIFSITEETILCCIMFSYFLLIKNDKSSVNES